MKEELSRMSTSKLRLYVLMSGRDLSKDEALTIYGIAVARLTATQFLDAEERADLDQIVRVISERGP